MKTMQTRSVISIGSGVIIFVFLDQISKWMAAQAFISGSSWGIPFFSLKYEQNTGIAWSIPVPAFILLPLNLAILGLAGWYAWKYFDLKLKISQIAIILILSGGLGNIIDRILLGYVRDFIAVGWWPVFNLADAFLCIGIFLILLFYAKIKRRNN
jgi:signal peptidase II